MSYLCSAEACKAKQGACIHEKVMIGLVVVIAAAVLIVLL